MTAPSKDLALVAAIAAGDQAAAETFAEKFRSKLVHIAKARSVLWQDCEDVAHETLLAAMSQMRRGLFRGESSLGTWLEKILHGKIADYWRSQPPRDLLPVPLTSQENNPEVGGVEILPSPVSDPVLRMTVHQVLERMSVRHRVVLLLNKRDGYTIEEISQRLGWPRGTVGRSCLSV